MAKRLRLLTAPHHLGLRASDRRNEQLAARGMFQLTYRNCGKERSHPIPHT